MSDVDFSDEFLEEFRVDEAVDSGGMATVFRARQRALDRECAIKLFQPSLFDEEFALERFHNEGKIIASLKHPNIVQVYSVGVDQDRPYLVLEFVRGENLKAVIKRNRNGMPPADALAIAVLVADIFG
ncbi:MAG: hypothetical protein EHM66_01855 [Deltaproteobacteria bacterium]|nr:MAG: hypothetical protein EHM66_01855 [Deltaproteobacteria bacterium]